MQCTTGGRHFLRRLQRRALGKGKLSSQSRHFSVRSTAGEMKIDFSTGKFARLADGAVLVQSGSTSVLVTAVSKQQLQPNSYFTPLQVDYRERAAATGHIPHNFFRRELRSSERETLISRFIDRSVRPLFPNGYAYDTQIICNVLAVDAENDPEVLGLNGAAAALVLAGIPWAGPVAAVRVAMINDQFVVNPPTKMLQSATLNIIVSSTTDRLVMVEGSAFEATEETFCEAVKLGMEASRHMIESISSLRESSRPLRTLPLSAPSPHIMETVAQFCRKKILDIYRNTSHMKASRDKALFAVMDETVQHFKDTELSDPDTGTSPSPFLIQQSFWNTCSRCMKVFIMEEQRRVDGRGMREVRPIECEVDLFDGLHGSASFRRGETQVMCSVTFDSHASAAKQDLVSSYIGSHLVKRFMVHYDFPPFATNETGHFLFSGRREIGHGALAEKAIQPLLPEDSPFTIRVASQVTDSNGSSSMATVCGSSLALFDAGVQMRKSVAGVACGLVVDSQSSSSLPDRYQILSDLTGIEDAVGNMDFKLAGTRDGITSCQLDLKGCHGIPFFIFEEAVHQSKEARLSVLDIMDCCCSSPRASRKECSPVSKLILVPSYRRAKLFGHGGYRIKSLEADTGAQVETVDDRHLSVFAPSPAALEEVEEKISDILNSTEQELDPGAIYNATIVDIQENGLFLELGGEGGTIAFLHSSHLQSKFLGHPSTLGYHLGQEICVKYFGKDPVTGHLQLSRKALMVPPLSASSLEQSAIRKGDRNGGSVWSLDQSTERKTKSKWWSINERGRKTWSNKNGNGRKASSDKSNRKASAKGNEPEERTRLVQQLTVAGAQSEDEAMESWTSEGEEDKSWTPLEYNQENEELWESKKTASTSNRQQSPLPEKWWEEPSRLKQTHKWWEEPAKSKKPQQWWEEPNGRAPANNSKK